MHGIEKKLSQILSETEIIFRHGPLLFNVDFIRIGLFQPNTVFGAHKHSNYEFHYVKNGTGSVIMRGKEFQLQTNSFYVTGPDVVHEQIMNEHQSMVEYVMTCDLILDASDRAGKNQESVEYANILDILDQNATYIVNDAFGIGQLYERFFEELLNEKAGYFIEAKNIITDIVVNSARNFAPAGNSCFSPPKKNINQSRISLLKKYICHFSSQNITAADLASQVNLSSRQLGRIIRDETGLSVYDFIMNEKIKMIKILLVESEIKLEEIAEKTGFSSRFHLSWAFKKYSGVSPAMYRKRTRRNPS